MTAFALLACGSCALGAEGSGPPEAAAEIGPVSTLVMLGFVLLAALVVVSFLCKIVIAMGLVRKSRVSLVARTIFALAGVTGDLRIVAGARDRGGRSRAPRGGGPSGGGGSAGGAGASGDL